MNRLKRLGRKMGQDNDVYVIEDYNHNFQFFNKNSNIKLLFPIGRGNEILSTKK